MPKKRQPKILDLILGQMPVAAINKAIGTELEAGDIVLTSGAQLHASRRHPEDYPKCLPHLGSVIANRRYIGDDHTNSGIEIWGYAGPISALVLVAVAIVPDGDGRYQISSFYVVSEKKAHARRLKGYLRVVAP